MDNNLKVLIEIYGGIIVRERIQWIENLRILSCFAVIMLHVIAGWTETVDNLQLDNFRWFLDNVIFQVLTRYAVPVFVMISGYLLLNPEKYINLQKLKKYILRMIGVIIVFGTGFALIENIFKYGLSNIFFLIYNSIIDMLQEKTWAHLWYVYMIIGLYILTPIIKAAINNLKENEVKFTLVALFVFSFIIPSINSLFDLKITTFFIGNELFSYLFYYMLGYYIGSKKIFKDKYIYISGTLGLIGYIILCLVKKYVISISLTNSNVFTCLYSMLIFKLFADNIFKFPDFKFKNIISDYSFGIYIIHTFWINLLNKGFGIYPDILPAIIGEVGFFVYALGFSLLSVEILKRIPLIKNII